MDSDEKWATPIILKIENAPRILGYTRRKLNNWPLNHEANTFIKPVIKNAAKIIVS